jgi:hypothetical protein
MGASRETPDDYDRWVNEFVCAGWGWGDMMAAFLPLEDDADYGGDGLQGEGRPLSLCRGEVRSPFDARVRTAVSARGYPTCDASVMLDLPRADTRLATVAIAEPLAAKVHR